MARSKLSKLELVRKNPAFPAGFFVVISVVSSFVISRNIHQHIRMPSMGERIHIGVGNSLTVPDRPVMPFIESDRIGSM